MKHSPIFLASIATAALLIGGCAQSQSNSHHDSAATSRNSSSAAPDREMNPITGNYERKPPYGPQSVKDDRQRAN